MLLEVSAICGILILLFYCAYSFAYAPYQVWKRYGIKGPTPVPFFGNYREEAKMKQSKYYKHLYQKYGPVVGYYIGQKPHILVADLDMLKQVLVKDFNNFVDRELSVERICLKKPHGIAFEEGETWKRNRRILAPTFSVTKMKIIMPLMQKTVDSLVKVFEDKTENTESFDCFKTYCSFTMETILAIAFGWSINIQGGEADELTEAAKTFFTQSEEGKVVSRDVLITLTSNFPFLIPIFQFLFNKTKAGEDAGKLVEIAQKIVQARKESGQRDGPEIILPEIFSGLFLMKGKTWKTNRRILSPTFSISKVKTMIPLVKKSVDVLLAMFEAKVATGASFDVTRYMGPLLLKQS